MKYVKTFESFKDDFQNKFNFNAESLNENLLTDIINFFKNIWDYISEKSKDFFNFIGDKWNEFKNKVGEISKIILNAIGDKLKPFMENIENIFGKSPKDLSLEDIKNGLKNMKEVKTLSSTNEDLDQPIGEFSKSDSMAVKILSILSRVFLVNATACFAPLTYLISLITGLGAIGALASSIIITYIAIIIFMTIRAVLSKSSEKTIEKIKNPRFLTRKQQLIDYITGTGEDMRSDQIIKQLGFEMSSKETSFVDNDGDGELDTEMITFKKDDILIFSGICFLSNEIKYVTTIRKNNDVLLEPLYTTCVEELNWKLAKILKR